MDTIAVERKFDLEERTRKFAISIRSFMKKIMKTRANIEDGKQLLRASGSVAANYIEASEAMSRKEYTYRSMMCRKEARECVLFLRLLDMYDNEMMEMERAVLLREAIELTKIFGSIVTKCK